MNLTRWTTKPMTEAVEGAEGSSALPAEVAAVVEGSNPPAVADATPTPDDKPGAEVADAEPDSAASVDWASLAEDDDELTEEHVPAEEVVEERSVVEPAAAVEPESTAALTEEAESTEPVPAATTEPATEESPTSEAETQAEPQTPMRTPEELAALRSQTLDGLAKVYGLSEEDSDTMLSEPGKVIPKLAANLHLQIYEDVVRAVTANLPNVVNSLVTTRQDTEKYVDQFYGDYPELRAHEKEVLQFSKVWRQMNPSASPEVAMREVGKHMKIALGITGVNTAPSPQRPSAPPTPAPAFAPTSPAPSGPTNLYTAFAEELEQEDF